jgi:LmbE family N-acetylglucosaminyl deacetylase
MAAHSLPVWTTVVVVVAHPDDESFGLGAVIDAFVRAGAAVQVVCLTRGEASTLVPAAGGLAPVRALEMEEATGILGVERLDLLDFPDGGLAEVPFDRLVDAVRGVVDPAEGLLAFDIGGLTGHRDHVRATEVAMALAERWGCGLLGWTLTEEVARTLRRETGAGFVGHPASAVDVTVEVDRAVQCRAIAAHRSQAIPGSALWRRLELQGSRECLRWLVRPESDLV